MLARTSVVMLACMDYLDCRRSEGQACMGRIYMAMHYRVDSQLVQYNGDEALKAIPLATALKLRYIPPRRRLGCHN